MKEEYGLFVWPSSLILAEYIWQQRFRFSFSPGINVVEVILFSYMCFVVCDYHLVFELSLMSVCSSGPEHHCLD